MRSLHSLVIVRDVACQSGKPDIRAIGQLCLDLEARFEVVVFLGLEFEL